MEETTLTNRKQQIFYGFLVLHVNSRKINKSNRNFQDVGNPMASLTAASSPSADACPIDIHDEDANRKPREADKPTIYNDPFEVT